MPATPADRRPLASRSIPFFQVLARTLAHSGVSPNAISLAGMGFGIASGAALLCTDRGRWAWLVAAALVQLRLICNMLDGMVAVEGGKVSSVGELYNEIPDRISDSATLIGLGYAAGGQVALGYAAALAAMLTAYIRAVGKGAGAPQDFSGPMAKPHRMFLATVLALFEGLAPAAWRPPWPLPAAMLAIILAGSLVTALRRAVRIGRSLRAPG